jgi:hypothetical protein
MKKNKNSKQTYMKKEIMKKIKLIEQLKAHSVENLDEIIGGTVFGCENGSTLHCTPFTGSCMKVVIGDDTYWCGTDIYSLQKKKEKVVGLIQQFSLESSNTTSNPSKVTYY